MTLKLGVKGGTKSGTGQASTSTALKITLPKGLKWNGKAWASSKRCSVSKANSQKTDKVCPKGSKIGSGHVDATALGTKEPIDVTAFVTTSGNLGLFLKADVPLSIRVMLEGKVKGNVINVAIPSQIQEPLPNVPVGHRDPELQPQRQDQGQGQDPRRHRVDRLLGRQVDAEVRERHDRRLAERLAQRQLQEVETLPEALTKRPPPPSEAGAAGVFGPPQ